MLFIHEVHTVRGRAEDEFEAAFRDGWMPTLAAGDDARLLWYTNHAHGSGPAYTVVTVTAVRDGPAWERLALRIQRATFGSGCANWMSCATKSRPNSCAASVVTAAGRGLRRGARRRARARADLVHGRYKFSAFITKSCDGRAIKPPVTEMGVMVTKVCASSLADWLRTGLD